MGTLTILVLFAIVYFVIRDDQEARKQEIRDAKALMNDERTTRGFWSLDRATRDTILAAEAKAFREKYPELVSSWERFEAEKALKDQSQQPHS